MSYSSVPAANAIRTRLAVLLAEQWVFVTELNEPFNASLPGSTCPGGVCTGVVVHEVSSLVEDPSDPDPARRVKLLAHTYLVGDDGALHYDIGHISLFTAPSLEAPGPWPRQPLLGWTSQSPFSSTNVTQVLTDMPALADCLAFTEPGALPPGPSGSNGTGAGLLLVALGCVYLSGGEPSIRIELLASADHAASFVHAGVLLTPAAVQSLGFLAPQVNAANLLREPATGAVYLSATPGMQYGYAGCLIFELAPAGPPLRWTASAGPLRYLNPGTPQFSGACTAAPPLVGWLLPTLFPPFHFEIMPSGIAPP